MLSDALIAAGSLFAGLCGAATCSTICAMLSRRSMRHRALERSGVLSAEALRDGLVVAGSYRFVLETCRRRSLVVAAGALPSLLRCGSSRIGKCIDRAGQSGRISVEGACRARFEIAMGFSVLAAAVGAFFSVEMAVLGASLAGIAGWGSISRSLQKEAQLRADAVQMHLPQMIEVLCLGLRSGLSFDAALELYCIHFDGMLAQGLQTAHSRWTSGLQSREESLRTFSRGYDAALLERAVSTVIRALRFGSSLSEGLESIAQEARRDNKAAIEEKVMKAPVKMMIPVGTLILPSMLLLVLGPVLLDLMEGF